MSIEVIAEIGINHNGSPDIALDLITEAAHAGVDAVKFQVGNPRLYVNRDRWHIPRALEDGSIVPYIEYRERMELSDAALRECQEHAAWFDLDWFASPLDCEAVDRLEAMGVERYKVASPMLTDLELLGYIKQTGKPVLVSTGMSSYDEIDAAVLALGYSNVSLLHCTSEYPCPPDHANLRCIQTLRELYPGITIGYSGHEIGLPETLVAVGLGAEIVERHLTLSRAMWGSDHAASLEPEGMRRLVRYIRTAELALGDGRKVIYDGEWVNAVKFRRSA